MQLTVCILDKTEFVDLVGFCLWATICRNPPSFVGNPHNLILSNTRAPYTLLLPTFLQLVIVSVQYSSTVSFRFDKENEDNTGLSKYCSQWINSTFYTLYFTKLYTGLLCNTELYWKLSRFITTERKINFYRRLLSSYAKKCSNVWHNNALRRPIALFSNKFGLVDEP